MGQPFTSGKWIVKEGREKEFIDAWRELAEWSLREVQGAISARLLQDRDDSRLFLSFGPWESLDAIEAWREMPGFKERVGKLRELLDGFEPHTLDVVAEVG